MRRRPGRSSFPYTGDETLIFAYSGGGLAADKRIRPETNQGLPYGPPRPLRALAKARTRKSCLPSGNSYQVEIPCWTSVFIDLRLANRMH